jgi:hypothetical protein
MPMDGYLNGALFGCRLDGGWWNVAVLRRSTGLCTTAVRGRKIY